MSLTTDDTERFSRSATTAYPRMTEDGVPASRYYAQSFADLENSKLWTRTWQPACRIEEIPRVGDYSEYTITDQSYLVVRVSESEIKAYSNHCRHRGNELGNGNGSYRSGKIVCSFHGWRWNLDGSNDKVFADEGFTPSCLHPDRLRLAEVAVAVAMGMVWINPDPSAVPFELERADVLNHWAPVRLSDMRVRWWRYMVIDANWKTVMEPFMESYHTAQTHPEIAGQSTVDDFDHKAFGTGYDYAPDGSGWGAASARGPADGGVPPGPLPGMNAIDYSIISNQALHDGIDSALMQDWQIAAQNELYHQQGLRDFEYMMAFNERMYAEAAARGMDVPRPEQGGGHGYGFIFPNIVVTAMYGNAFIQRTRPVGTDPEKALVEWYAVALPQKDHKAKRPKRIGPLEYEDWGFVVQQDLSNIEKIQRGVKTAGFTGARFSERYEGLILNFHRKLEEYLDR
jgi:phenylpropionate dioxygenase-like ring-hydroxylating dioxygenase large terminal subunit